LASDQRYFLNYPFMLKKILPFFLCLVSAFAQEIPADLLIETKDSISYVDGIDLGKKMKLPMTWHSEAGILQIGSSSWVLENRWVNAKDTVFLMPVPVLGNLNGKKSFWLPHPSAMRVFERMTGPLKDIWNVNVEARGNGEVIELKLSKPFKAEHLYAHPNYILRITGAVMDSTMFLDLAKKSSLIARVISVQEAQSSQFTFTLRDNIEAPELLKKDGGKTLQIVLRKKPSPKAETTPIPSAGGKKIKTIVLDPGHGGKDPGAIGVNGVQEKDIVLKVGLKLKQKLEDKGFTVKMTRSKDEFVELEKRPKMASDWGGDLFLSLHCDAIAVKERQPIVNGFKFYILRAGGSEEDNAIARRENQVVALETDKKRKTEISPAEWIILDNQLALYAEKSALLAGHLVESFDGGSIRKLGTGAGQAGFMVLVGAFMPAVLAELGFITNPTDAALLASDKGQEELAERLSKAINSFAQ